MKPIKIQISNDTDYHTQRNNKRSPMASCNTTSAIMMLKASNVDFKFPDYMQEEDYLTMITESDEAFELMKKNYSWAIKGGYRPAEVHGVLEWAINKLVGEKIDTFSAETTLEKLIFQLLNGKASLVSGRFTDGGHIVCLVGFITNQQNILQVKQENEINLNEVTHFIIDDPYGDPLTDYKNHKGNNIELTKELFDWYTKEYNKNSKWAHILA